MVEFSDFKLGRDFDSLSLASPDKCSGSEGLLVLIVSAPGNQENRDVIRNTWGAHNAKLVFLIGRSQIFDSQVSNEAKVYNDVFIYDLVDTYLNLTTKTLMGYQ